MRACSLHRFHRPRPLTSEEHHVIPQAWQHFALTGEVAPERAANGDMLLIGETRGALKPYALFDPRTVSVAPTCHRNVHYWIVEMMKATVPAGKDEDPLYCKLAVFGNRALTAEQACAYDALTRYRGSGHSLVGLRAQRLYGYA